MIIVIAAGVIFHIGILKSHENIPLILTPYIERGETEIARALSRNDPMVLKNIKSYSGFINVNETESWNLFFWYFPNKKKSADQTPWIIWLQGGPGMSSLYGLFKEIGPLQIINGKVEKMSITWATDYSLLFIDNPAGSGFSFSERKRYPTTEDEIGESLLNFIKQFIEVFPEVKEAPLFIAGEEYGAKFATGLAYYIHHYNISNQLKLKGLIIGDGWIDPPNLLHYSKWALQVGLIDYEQAERIEEAENMARKFWEEKNIYHYAGKAKMAYNILKSFAPFDDLNYLKDDTDNRIHEISNFLNQEKIKKMLHVGDITFNFIDFASQNKLYEDIYLSVRPWLEELLEHYGVLCYSGQLDMVMAYALLVESYRSLEWSGREEYLKAHRAPMFGPNHIINGYVKTAGNFMEAMVRGAGQHVPEDNPKAAKQTIDLFINKFI
ncbi:vitellogenic carboxypeptidase-like isoform X2 [Battus philenor]|uniref:vitellogenic carboxypeptidase-like isoform X2 n=1 Tax=Battus philenor TaxID=42288 RepID=UPI0035CF1C05